MLDTNIVSNLMRYPYGPAAGHLDAVGPESACISILVAAELRFGAVRKGSVRLLQEVDMILDRIPIVPLGTPTDQAYAAVRNDLAVRGTPIGPTDLLIAAHALALDLILVTANIREFSRVPGLRVENWLD